MIQQIYVTGDLHDSMDMDKLDPLNFKEGEMLREEDFVIIAGDFACLWKGNGEDEKLLNRLKERPFTTLFVDGSHENFDLLNAYPIEQWNGGKVHHISKKVIHLMRGQVFNISGVTIFTFGGAASPDKNLKTENINWWKEELPSDNEMVEGIRNLERYKLEG